MRLRRLKRPPPTQPPAQRSPPAMDRRPSPPRIDSLLSKDRVACGQCATSKKRVLENAAALLAAANPDLNITTVFESLMSRERLGSTGLGHGIALPHGRLPYRGPPVGAFITLREAVDFDAPDEHPVNQIFALIIPDNAAEEHLQILAALARLFNDPKIREQLQHCDAPDRAIDLFRDR